MEINRLVYGAKLIYHLFLFFVAVSKFESYFPITATSLQKPDYD